MGYGEDVVGAFREGSVYQEERSFILRFTLEAKFPEDYEGEEDSYGWLKEWDTRLKPELLKTVFASLRQHPSWTAHIRNRGVSPDHEIEIALLRDFS